jgi:hypothetical protein
MRLLMIAILGIASPAFADRVGGGGGGGGRLGQVSSGMATATGSTTATSGSSSGRTRIVEGNSDCAQYRAARERDTAYRVTLLERYCGYMGDPNTDRSVHRGGATNEPGAWVQAFAGAQKVYESDGSLSVALSVVDQRVRLNGSFTQYYETEMNGDHITMMVPELTGGLRLGADGPTRVWVEGGVMYMKTNDPRGNSSVAGPSVGARLEQRMSDNVDLVGTVEGAYLQDGVRAWAGRVGVRYHHVEAAFRVLDLNVGPALFGPELGVGF